MTCEEAQGLIAAYLLGALDPEDKSILMDHVKGCPACFAALQEGELVVGHLAFGVKQVIPPPLLKRKLLARAEALKQGYAVGKISMMRNLVASLLGALWGGRRAVLYASLAMIAALTGWIVYLQLHLNMMEKEYARLAGGLRGQAVLLGSMASQDLAVIKLEGTDTAPLAYGHLFLELNRTEGLFITKYLPSLPEDRVYQLWLITYSGERVSGGTFTVDRLGYGQLLINSPNLILSYRSIRVTVEPAGGSAEPTGEKVLASKRSFLEWQRLSPIGNSE